MSALLILVLGATLVSAAARRAGVSVPITLVVAGLAVSFLPGVPDYHLDPQFVLLVFLPPLVYSDALESSYVNLRANVRPIALLSIGLVLFTMLTVGLVVHEIIPGMRWAEALVLGAIVAPTDAVAAVSVARRLGLPRRVVTILVAESIVNDGTGMTVFRMAVGTALGGGLSLLQGSGEFLLASCGGLAVGLLLGWLVQWGRRWLSDAVAENTMSVLVPFVAYLVSESLHASGVLAVLAAGLHLGHHSTGSSHEVRLQEQATWKLITRIVEAVVFALIGLQLRPVLGTLRNTDAAALACYAAVVFGAVVLSRICWIFPATYLPRRLSARIRQRDPSPPWQLPAVISWAGMRGVVSLAAAFAVPPQISHRGLLLFLAFSVVLATLIVQGLAFPAVVRRLGVQEEGQAHKDDLSEAVAQEAAAHAAWARVEELVSASRDATPGHVIARLRELTEHRRQAAWERLGADGLSQEQESPTAAYRRLRREMVATERRVFVDLCREGRINDDVLRRVMHDLDLEEAVLCRD